jgi:Mn-dependent DtxR family transcriptional regulator
MLPNIWSADVSGSKRAPSRQEIEELCILYVIKARSCSAAELAARLGLSPTLGPTVAEALEPLKRKGWLERDEDLFSLTDSGLKRLEDRLIELGVT